MTDHKRRWSVPPAAKRTQSAKLTRYAQSFRHRRYGRWIRDIPPSGSPPRNRTGVPAIGRSGTFPRALDIGCGAGVSTRALIDFAGSCIGLEPSEAMLKWAPKLAPSAGFIVGSRRGHPAPQPRCRPHHRGRVAQLRQSGPLLSRGRARPDAARNIAGLRFFGGKEFPEYNQPGRVVFQLPPALSPAGERGARTQPRHIGGTELRISRRRPPPIRDRASRSRPRSIWTT